MPVTRRDFLGGTLAYGSGLALPYMLHQAAAPAVPAAALAEDPMRPQFHLLPAQNWMNDPNGPIYFDGRYHMFMQYNPRAAVWGNMSWNHAVSPDMLHWTHEPLALTETPGGPDADGCFSGSCIAVTENGRKQVYAIYTGVVKDTVHPTIKSEGLKESQCLAWSDDDLLRTWIKAPQPVVPEPPPGLDVVGFRDPAVWQRGEWYYMTLGSGTAGVGGCVLLYRSKNLRTWEYLHLLTSGKGTGKPAANPVGNGDMCECPDLFALDGGHVLIYSTMGKVYWQSGKLDEATLTFSPRHTGLLDLDAFYAPKTQLDAEGRRILWGWIPERRSDAAMLRAGWSGMMSLPRLLHLDSDGMLRVTILPEMKNLRAGELPVSGPSSATLPQSSGELLCTGTRGTNFRLDLTVGAAPLLAVQYHAATQTMTVDGKEVTLGSEDQPTLHAFVDGSVLEVIVAGRVGCTKRFYAESPQAPDIRAEVSAAALELWKIAPISPNRLTTAAPLNSQAKTS